MFYAIIAPKFMGVSKIAANHNLDSNIVIFIMTNDFHPKYHS